MLDDDAGHELRLIPGMPAIGEDPRRVGQQQRAGDEADDGEEHHRRVRRLRPGMQEMATCAT